MQPYVIRFFSHLQMRGTSFLLVLWFHLPIRLMLDLWSEVKLRLYIIGYNLLNYYLSSVAAATQ